MQGVAYIDYLGQDPLQSLHVFRFQTFRTFYRIKTYTLVFVKSLETTSGDCLVMHEHVRAVILSYKPKALLVVEPLYGSFCQIFSPPLLKNEQCS